jgi:hypothetical protein
MQAFRSSRSYLPPQFTDDELDDRMNRQSRIRRWALMRGDDDVI